jgi:uncharacterized membrane-anchored protein YjiN (DUF445 family)
MPGEIDDTARSPGVPESHDPAESDPGQPAGGQDTAPSESSEPVRSIEEARAVTRQRVRDFRSLLAKYTRRHLPHIPPRQDTTSEPPRVAGSYARLLPLLKVIPSVLAIGFAVSFIWDFPDMQASIFGYRLELSGLLRIVTVSGLIGFLTNWLAITMLFNPREKRPFFGQGLIPAQRERVVYRLARAVSDELINEQIIKQKIEESRVIQKYREMALGITRGVIEDPEFRRDLKLLTADYLNRVVASDEVRDRIVDFTVNKLEQQLGDSISGLALKVYRFLNEEDFRRRLEDAVLGLPSALDNVLDDLDQLLDAIPEKIEARSEEIESYLTRIVLGFVENLDVYGMIMSNMANYDERRLEDLIKRATNEQLNYIKYLGGVLGSLGGLVIWRPLLALAAFATVGVTLYLADEVIWRLGQRRVA